MPDLKEFTVIAREIGSPHGKAYGDPLIYLVSLPETADEADFTFAAARQRSGEVGFGEPHDIFQIAAGLRVILVFEGALSPIKDWRE